MKSKVFIFLGWILGISGFIDGIVKLFSSPLDAVYILSFSVIIFPPINDIITKSRYAKLIKITIGVLFFGSFIYSMYLSQKPNPGSEMDGIKHANVSITQQIAKSYCVKNGRCPSSLDELFKTGVTGPYESYKIEDYFYRSIDNGKDCVISTLLSTNERYTVPCIGENLSYIKYLKDPFAK